jgi:hypothetical protein
MVGIDLPSMGLKILCTNQGFTPLLIMRLIARDIW